MCVNAGDVFFKCKIRLSLIHTCHFDTVPKYEAISFMYHSTHILYDMLWRLVSFIHGGFWEVAESAPLLGLNDMLDIPQHVAQSDLSLVLPTEEMLPHSTHSSHFIRPRKSD